MEPLTDPVEFLQEIRDECPSIVSILNTKQTKLLAKSADTPYERGDVNEEYLTDMAAYTGASQKVEDSNQALRNALLTPHTARKEIDVENFEKQTTALKKVRACKYWGRVCLSGCAFIINDVIIIPVQVSQRMKLVIDGRLATTEKTHGETALPRVVRMCRKLKLTGNESRISIYALVLQSGYDRDSRYAYGSDVVGACQFLEIPLQEMLDFLDKDRMHMQQGFFPDIQDSYILNSSIAYDSDFCKALMGSQLKSTEFLKLEQTLLADVIAEEPGNEHYRYAVGGTLELLPMQLRP